MSDNSTLILICLICVLSLSIGIGISIGLFLYFMNQEGTYGTYIDTNNKTQLINSLPITFTAKSIKAIYPGCIPKPNFNPVDKAPIICSEGMFKISGQQNSDDGGFTTFNGIAGKFSASSPVNTSYTVTLTKASNEEYQAAQKKING